MFSARTLTSDQARVIAEAYLKASRNPNKVGEALGIGEFDKNLLAHPLVRRQVIAIARMNVQTYSMTDHMEKLAEIRDKALDEGKFTAALGAEMSIGKAAGLYDKTIPDDDINDPAMEPQKLTSAQIRELLSKRSSEEQVALPAPGNELEEQGEPEFFIQRDPDEDPDTFMEDGVP